MFNHRSDENDVAQRTKKGFETYREVIARVDWKQFKKGATVLTGWGVGLLWSAITEDAKREKLEHSIRLGKAIGCMSTLIQRAILPADLADVGAYRDYLWTYFRSQHVNSVELRPSQFGGRIDFFVEKALMIQCEYNLTSDEVVSRANFYNELSGNWMVWILAFQTKPGVVSALENYTERKKGKYPIFVIPFFETTASHL